MKVWKIFVFFVVLKLEMFISVNCKIEQNDEKLN